MTTTTIDPQAEVITLINVFDVSPERQEELVSLLDRATLEVMRHQPGFVSANIHKSLDGSRVANYAQWQSVADFERMLKNPEAQHHMKAASAMAQAVPTLYQLSSVHR
jgi:quinol monooxygenase YgiN